MNMLLIFPIVLLSYAAMHAYLGIKLVRAFPRLRPFTAWFLILFTGLFAAPFLTRWFGNRGYPVLAALAGAAGYTWIAIVFWFFSIGLLLDAWNLAIRVTSLFSGGLARGHIPARPAVLANGAAILLAIAWGTIEARWLRVETVVLQTDRLPEGTRYRIVQVSDLHLAALRGGRMLAKIGDAVRELRPDLLVSTGDLIDAPLRQLAAQASAMAGWQARGGFFGVLGNHEYFTGLRESLAFHQAASIRLLRAAAAEPLPRLWLAGVDDPAGWLTRQPHFADERPLAAARPADGFVILLKHQPLVGREAGAWFDLQLSGHTHGGQMFPFEWFLKPIYPWRRGLHEIAPGRRLYVCRGAGTWGPPLRLFARPELTLIVLEGGRPRPP